jgi:hypothetical protein
MYKCLKCNKGFKFESKLKEHENRKNPCDNKEELKCNYCNITFTCPYNKIIHEKTKKHIDNININIIEEHLLLDKKELEIEELKKKIEQLKDENKKLKNDNQELNNKIKFLEVENQNLKNNNDIHSGIEYIYIIHCAQHINTNIYKVGRTKDILRRYNDYPKGSKILLTLSCDNSKLMETKILNYLKESANYLHYKPAGNEYFQCDIKILKSDIQKILSEN